jgi:hypothetical protein
VLQVYTHLKYTERDHKPFRTIPDSLMCFGMIVIRQAAARIVLQLPPLAILAGRKTRSGSVMRKEKV